MISGRSSRRTGGDLQASASLCACANCSAIADSKVRLVGEFVGRQRRHRAGVRRRRPRGQRSPLWPQSLMGSGMALAGAALRALQCAIGSGKDLFSCEGNFLSGK